MKPSETFYALTGRTYLYNIQSIFNILSIEENGILSHKLSCGIQHSDLSNPDVQGRRDIKSTPFGIKLHEYANVYFDYWNPMLYILCKHNPRENICILKISSEILDIQGCVISDCNAASGYARFQSPDSGLNDLEWDLVYAKYWKKSEENEYSNMHRKSVKCAEVLIPNSVSTDFIEGYYVYSDETKDYLINQGVKKPIEVRKEFFF